MNELKSQWELDVASGYPNPESLWQYVYDEHDTWTECPAAPKFGNDALLIYRRCKDADDLIAEWQASKGANPSYYHRQFNGKSIDVYDVLVTWNATHPCQQHAIKKLLRAGQSIKPLKQDVEETIATLQRWIEMIEEDTHE